MNSDADKPDVDAPDEPAPAESQGQRFSLKRLLPLLVLVAGMIAFFDFCLHEYVTFEMLREHREYLLEQVNRYGLLAGLAFCIVYALTVVLSLPGGAVLTITGGFLFGPMIATLYAVVAATVGATALFIVAKTSIGDVLRAKARPWLGRMENGFNRNAFNYLLFVRLIPIFPFFVVNLVPAFLGVALRTYVAATFIGIIPATFVFASLGNGLGALFDAGKTPDLGIIFNPEIFVPILLLAMLTLVPIAYKRFARRRRVIG